MAGRVAIGVYHDAIELRFWFCGKVEGGKVKRCRSIADEITFPPIEHVSFMPLSRVQGGGIVHFTTT